MKIEVTKLTDVELLRKCAGFTSGKECGMSLLTAYRNKHSIIRTQLFVIEMTDIPLFCASQFVRSTQGVNWYQHSKRTDRGGEDFIDVCRNLAFAVRSCWVPPKGFTVEQDYAVKCCDSVADAIDRLPDHFDRYAPTDLLGIMNAEAIMNMSEKRLCSKASAETRDIWQRVLVEVAKIDPDLVKFCVRPCVSHGGICRESKCCGFNKSDIGEKAIEGYKKLFEK